jgi:nitrite reductase (NADH) large subunit
LYSINTKGVTMPEAKKSWICLVCGYLHQGDEAPEACPICGAPATDFELHATEVQAKAEKATQWRCVICGYGHKGDNPPEVCPVCAASGDDFEPEELAGAPVAGSKQNKQKIVIVGGGIAGVSGAEHARKTAPESEIYLYSKEVELPYYRLNLTRYLAGEIGGDSLPLHPQQWYDEQHIHLHCGIEVSAINPESHTLELSGGKIETYDKLILACGAHPFIPPIPGAQKSGVTAVRTRQDVEGLASMIGHGTSCVCIGGGILGLEAAGALAKRGAAVTLLEGFGYLLPRQLNEAAAQVLESHLANLGITVKKKANTREISGDGRVESVLLDSSEVLPAELVAITTGVRSNTHLARRAGIQVNSGIVVDSHLRTSAPDIYAVGDAAEWGGTVYGLWEPARFQGAIAGQNAAGNPAEFGGVPRMNTLKVLGIDMFSIGIITPEDGSYTEISAESDGVYRRFLFHDNLLAGAILVGDTKITAAIVRAIKDRMDMSALLARHPDAGEVASFLAG